MASTYYSGTCGTGSTAVWETWTSSTTASTTATSSDVCWGYWTGTQTSTAATTTTNDTWYVWVGHDDNGVPQQYVGRSSGTRYMEYEIYGGRERKPLHDAHVVARDNEQRRIAAEKRRQERKAAEARAEELLHTSLTDAQRSDLKRDGFFFVDSKREGRRYRIRKGRMGNVDVMERGRVLHRLCAHPNVQCPDDDTRLAQKLMLEHMEDRFIGLANVHPAPRH